MYSAIVFYLRMALGVFFRSILVFNDPTQPLRSTIVAGNHPNALIDPAIVIMLLGTRSRLSFLAKSTLFKVPVLGWILRTLEMLPVYRRQDAKDGEKVNNDAVFEACFNGLIAGRNIGIFPEGVSLDEPHLQDLRTGAARIALGAKAKDPDCPIQILPVGLTYFAKDKFRSKVRVEFAEPILITTEMLDRFNDDPRAEARALTALLEDALRRVTLNASDLETLDAALLARRLFTPPVEFQPSMLVAWTNKFVQAYETGVSEEDEDMRQLKEDLVAYNARCASLGLQDQDVVRNHPVWLVVFDVIFQLILFPLSLIGFLLWSPIILLAHREGVRFRAKGKRENVSTVKLLLSTVGLIVLWLIEVIVVSVFFQFWWIGLCSAFAIPLCGLIFGKAAEEEWRGLKRLKSCCSRAGLLEERERLAAVVDEQVEKYRDRV